jgi:uncharacterized membrane protein YdbT with pleckstrin-like domain
MSYVDEHLLPGERVVYRAHLHKIIYAVPVTLAAVLLVGAVMAFYVDALSEMSGIIALVLFLIACTLLVYAWVSYNSSEFAVTDKRVIIKVGWIKRRTLETMLAKVEGIGVDQGILGRMLDYGTLTVTGTGGTKEPFPNIADPLEFRRQVQGQVAATEDTHMLQAVAAGPPREERDCPFCAERILVRAKVCKHCGRDV